jgi:hypothetical protein
VTPPKNVSEVDGSPSACNKSSRREIAEAQSIVEIILYMQNTCVLIYNTAENRVYASLNKSLWSLCCHISFGRRMSEILLATVYK